MVALSNSISFPGIVSVSMLVVVLILYIPSLGPKLIVAGLIILGGYASKNAGLKIFPALLKSWSLQTLIPSEVRKITRRNEKG